MLKLKQFAMLLALLLLPGLCACAAQAPGSQNSTGEEATMSIPASSGQAAGSAPSQPVGWQTITADAAKEMMEAGAPYLLLDVRAQEEYDEGHIKGAVLIPHDQLAGRAGAELPDKDAVILVYCRSGRRSALAAQTLAELGYTQVYDFGGILDWPYDTVVD